MTLLTAIILLTGFLYLGFLTYFFFGLRKLEPVPLLPEEQLPEIAIVVAARNEEAHIENTVRSLVAQNYPAEKYEIVVVNDRSEDATGAILERLLEEVANLRVMTISDRVEGISPKKYALIRAVQTIDTSFVAATDADCVHDKNWLRAYASSAEESLGVATGFTIFDKTEYRSKFEYAWQQMQYLEHNSQHLVAAGSIGQGLGLSANGNNMMFNAKLYEQYGKQAVKSHITSGDDFFLIQAAAHRGYSLKFLVNQETIVHTVPEPTLRDLINQRARWASKIGDGSSSVVLFSANTFLYYLGITLYPLSALFGVFSWQVFVMLWGMKIFADTFYVSYGYGKLGLRVPVLYFILMQIFHAPFILVSAIKGMLGSFSWKGAEYNR